MPDPDNVIPSGACPPRILEGLYWFCDELVWCAGGPSATPLGDLIVMYTVLTSDVPGRMNTVHRAGAAAWPEVATLVLRADDRTPPFPQVCGVCKWWTRQVIMRGTCDHPRTLPTLTMYETAAPPPECPRRSDLPTK
jgi:hypothetical protein